MIIAFHILFICVGWPMICYESPPIVSLYQAPFSFNRMWKQLSAWSRELIRELQKLLLVNTDCKLSHTNCAIISLGIPFGILVQWRWSALSRQMLTQLLACRFLLCGLFFNTEVFPVRALPSSGIIPLLQQFCNNKDKDEHGFPVHPNARYN